LDDVSLAVAGGLLWNQTRAAQTFAVGSAGLTHSLIRYWRQIGMIPKQYDPPPAAPADRLIVISGSCSPVTESQIRWTMQNGFANLRVNPATGNRDALITEALAALSGGCS